MVRLSLVFMELSCRWQEIPASLYSMRRIIVWHTGSAEIKGGLRCER